MKQLTIRNKGDDVVELLLYDVNGEDWFGGISAKTFRRQLKEVKASTINLRINSPGGDVVEMAAMLAALDEHPARIEVDVDGLAASAASAIMLAGDVVRVASNALVMIHNPHVFAAGEAADLRRKADLLDTIKEQLLDRYESKAGEKTTRKQFADWMNEEKWFTGKEAVEAGLADEATGVVRVAAYADLLQVAAKLGAKKPPQVQAETDAARAVEAAREETRRRREIAARW